MGLFSRAGAESVDPGRSGQEGARRRTQVEREADALDTTELVVRAQGAAALGRHRDAEVYQGALRYRDKTPKTGGQLTVPTNWL